MLDERNFPPVRASNMQEESNEELIQKIKDGISQWLFAGAAFLDREKALAGPLARLRKRVSHGQWLALLEDFRLSRYTVNRWIRNLHKAKPVDPKCCTVTHLEDALKAGLEEVSDEEPSSPPTKLQSVCHFHWKQGIKSPVKGCLDCKAAASQPQALPFEPPPSAADETTTDYSPPPAAENGKPKKERQPGEDKPEPLDRAQKIVNDEIDEASRMRQVGEAQVVGLKGQARNLFVSLQQLTTAPLKKPMKPFEKKCLCGIDITVAQTAKGKKAAFQAIDGKRGKFNLVDGIMVYDKGGGDFFLHRIRCPRSYRK